MRYRAERVAADPAVHQRAGWVVVDTRYPDRAHPFTMTHEEALAVAASRNARPVCARCPEHRPDAFHVGDRLCKACRRRYNADRKRELRDTLALARQARR